MSTVDVVIGAGYGDEGKGLMTDYLASKGKSTVVRFNGGAQASHTVVRGIRHAFSHFGAGTLAGADTFLSKFFVVNPFLFKKEREVLHEKGVQLTTVAIDKDCLVTTPYDIVVNQLLEHVRDHQSHGSCGVGFGATIDRHEKNPLLTIKVGDMLRGESYLRNKLDGIREEVISQSSEMLDSLDDTNHGFFMNILASPGVVAEFLTAVKGILFDSATHLVDGEYLRAVQHSHNVIFEGAQGLELDQHYGFFPHVTRSNTGIQNVADLLNEIGYTQDVDVHYMTRAYKTRHGNGPLAHAEVGVPFHVEDQTNQPNQFQGTMRYAPLNLEALARTILVDQLTNESDTRNFNVINKVCVTWMDIIDYVGKAPVVTSDRGIVELTSAELLLELQQELDKNSVAKIAYASFGPTAKDIKRV